MLLVETNVPGLRQLKNAGTEGRIQGVTRSSPPIAVSQALWAIPAIFRQQPPYMSLTQSVQPST